MSLPNVSPDKEYYAKSVCLFLAEMLRTRKPPLKRCAEIAQKVIQNLNLVDSEQDFLRLIKELSRDFEELVHLEQIVFMHIKVDEHRSLDQKVTEFVIYLLAQDAHQAALILKEAVKEGATEQKLGEMFPQFKQFNEIKHERIRS